jgi:UDP-N-acetylmuramyl pentapeptide synthase
MLPPLEWTVADCVEATGGEVLGSETGICFGEICIDSRRISPRDLFVAIKGETHDGHRFAGDVVRKGGRGLLLARAKLPELPWAQWIEEEVTCIVVDDTIEALGLLAAYHRNRNNAAVVAITGSNGKTTTRQMTAAVVSQRFPTLSTRKNFNNNIGLPLTLLELCPDHRWAVVELGMNAPGEIAAWPASAGRTSASSPMSLPHTWRGWDLLKGSCTPKENCWTKSIPAARRCLTQTTRWCCV